MRRPLRARKILLWSAATIAAVVVLLCALTPVLSSRVVKRRVLPMMSTRLGLALTVEQAHVKLLPGATVWLEQLDARNPQTQVPLVHVASVRAEVRAWPFIRSFGH